MDGSNGTHGMESGNQTEIILDTKMFDTKNSLYKKLWNNETKHPDMRIKTKFWGKSMEIIPFGDVHVLLKRSRSHYKWNKVTTCVHNIIKGQRWVDQYGEMIITDDLGMKCSLTFIKASYWSNKKHEISGVITSNDGQVMETIFGKWDESLYAGTAPSARCIWRPGAMNPESSLYYGFSRFAIELNELTPDLVNLLPPTDTRFRPDQRYVCIKIFGIVSKCLCVSKFLGLHQNVYIQVSYCLNTCITQF